MVLPFAPVISVWCYFFLFLSLYTASCSPYLHHIQLATATVSLFDCLSASRLDAIDVNTALLNARADGSNTMAHLTSVNTSPLRRLWDPGGMAMASIVRCSSMLPLDDCSMLVLTWLLLTWLLLLFTVTMASTMLTDPSRPIVDSVAKMLLPPLLSPSTTTMVARNESIDQPLISSVTALATVTSSACLFHYSHPVLSRPTVPNIIFNNLVQCCRWCLL